MGFLFPLATFYHFFTLFNVNSNLQWTTFRGSLQSQDGANKLLQEWATDAGLNKHISWHCARHSFSVLLQDNGVDAATVASMLGHTSTKFFYKTYQRYKDSNGQNALENLPDFSV